MSPLPGYADSPTYPTDGAEPGTTGQVTDYLARLGRLVGSVRTAIDLLEGRLASVLQDGTVMAVNVAPDVAPVRVPLAAAMADLEAQLDGGYAQLVDIERRVEL